MKAQMKAAGRSGARVAIIVGADEVAEGTATLRDLTRGEQTTVKRDEVVAHVRTMLEG
jgi:histidyl-tRNA synthetase